MKFLKKGLSAMEVMEKKTRYITQEKHTVKQLNN